MCRVFFEYRLTADGPVEASGTVSAAYRGIWRSGELNGNNLRPALVSVSRDDTVGAAAGTFAIANTDGVTVCAGYWTLAGKDATSLYLTEVFNDGQTSCIGPGSATLDAVAGALTYTRSVDGGTGDASAPLTRF